MADRLNSALQENLLSLIAHNSEVGKIIVNIVDANMFEGDYKIVAERAVDYWKRYKEAPKEHTADLLSDIINDKTNRRASTFKRILSAMYDIAPNVNTKYIVDQCRIFVRVQKMKSATMESAEILEANPDLGDKEVEELWYKILRVREFEFDPGIRLSDYKHVLAYMERVEGEFKLGIKPLDDRRIVPMRGTLFALLAVSGRGKTWGAVHVGKAAVLQRKKVLHLSLEMGQEQIMQRYYQALFAVPKHETKSVDIMQLKMNNLGKLESLETEQLTPEFSLEYEDVSIELETHLEWIGVKLSNLIIKSFPMRSLTMNGLRAYLDNLELVEGFIPDLLIVDAPYLMKLDIRNYRLELGRNVEELRGLCSERNMAGFMTHQLSREGARTANPQVIHIGEDWSIVQTCDFVTILSATDEEFDLGLGRLYVGKGRDERDKFGVLITQQYATGQFALQAIYLAPQYWDRLKELKGNKDAQYDEDEEDYDDD